MYKLNGRQNHCPICHQTDGASASPAWWSEMEGNGQGSISEFGGRQFIIVNSFFWNVKKLHIFQSYILQFDTCFLSSIFPLFSSLLCLTPGLFYPVKEEGKQGEDRGKKS